MFGCGALRGILELFKELFDFTEFLASTLGISAFEFEFGTEFKIGELTMEFLFEAKTGEVIVSLLC
jgi:hypothetical protein